MIVYVFSIIFLIFGICVWIREKTFNPASLFLILWATILFLAKLNLMNYYEICPMAYTIVIVGVIGYGIGSLIGSKLMFSIRNGTATYNNSLFLNIKGFKRLFYFWVLTTVPLLFRSVSLLVSGASMKYLRSTYLDVGESIIKHDFEYYLMTFFYKPFVFCITIYCVIYVFNYGDVKDKVKTIIYNVVALIIISLITGGSRSDMINFAIALIVGFFLFKYKELHRLNTNWKNLKLLRRIVVIGVILGIIVFSYITIARASKYKFWTLAYNYLVGCMPYFSHILQTDEIPRSYGFAFFNGFLRFIIASLRMTGIISKNPTVYANMAALTDSFSSFAYIGDGLIFNSFTTCFLYFYMDFRFVGVFILSGLFGSFSMSVFKKAKLTDNLYWSAIYLMIVFMIIFSMVRWQLFDPKYAFAFLYLRLFFRKNNGLMKIED